MKHLKLGLYSFIIDVDELGLVSETQKLFARDELPDNLKSLFDIVKDGYSKCIEKSIFINAFSKTNEYAYSGVLCQESINFILNSGSVLIMFSYEIDEDKLAIIYNEY